MKKILLSTFVAITLGTVSATAGIKFYTDANGQVFVTPGKGRTLLNVNPQEVIDAMQTAQAIKSSDKEVMKKEIKAELKEEMKKDTPSFAKASKLKFSGTHYLGYNYTHFDNAKDGTKKDSFGRFEMRRNYVQVKAYLLEDPKSYLRVTLDAVTTAKAQGAYSDETHGYSNIYVKYAYLYLNDVLPYTGVEFGVAHRPWIDYESHYGWAMRSISKAFGETSEAAHLTNSSDLGVNFKTKTPYFTSEVGLYNGEGYHGNDGNESTIGSGNSLEWRFTAAVLGNGDKKRKLTKDTFLDASFFGQYNVNNSKNEVTVNGAKKEYDYTFMGAHVVYNMPSFLIAAQYISADNDAANKGTGTSQFNGDGYSLNTTFRFGTKKQYSIIGRYDVWEAENEVKKEKYKTNNSIYGVAWQQNKNLKWLLSGQTYNAKDYKNYKGHDTHDFDATMVTAEVKW